MATSSSANKVAKLAQKGKGKKVRFQGGTLFPAVVAVVLVLGLVLITYARNSRPGPGAGEPRVSQHWHAAFGIYGCDDKGLLFLPKITGTLEAQDAKGVFTDQNFKSTGVHTHDDGVMHWHPYSGKASGNNAKLKVFLNNYKIKLSDKKLVMPSDQGGQTFEEGKTKCTVDGKNVDAQLKLWVWDSYANIGKSDPQVYTAGMPDVRIKNDGMVFVIAFVPKDVKPIAPDWAAELPTLGAKDSSNVPTTTIVGVTNGTENVGTTVAGSTTATTGSAGTTPGATPGTTKASDTTTATTGG